jgi:hypothetical protein
VRTNFGKNLVLCIAIAPFLISCGGASDPVGASTSAPPACTGSSCTAAGTPPPTTPPQVALCPATADIVNSTYLGVSGAGEIVSVNVNATAMTYTLSWLESSVPTTAGQVVTNRQGVTITGSVAHPPTGFFPTTEQTRCAFILEPGSGAIPSGGTYSTASTFNTQNPPMIMVGQNGVATGAIPGASIEYDGDNLGSDDVAFPIVQRTLDFYPFIGFASVDTNIADLQGTYNTVAYHSRATDNWAAIGENAVETFDASGDCSAPASPTGCISTGGPATTGQGWLPVTGAGYFVSTNIPQLLPAPTFMLSGFEIAIPPRSQGYMVLGKAGGTIVPVVVRAGVLAPQDGVLFDDESGIAILGSTNALTSGGLNGTFIGADSNFKYTGATITGSNGTYFNVTTLAAQSTFDITYGGSTPGIATTVDAQNNPGIVVSNGGVVASLMQGTENGGITATSSFAGQVTSAPYFGIGMQVSQ